MTIPPPTPKNPDKNPERFLLEDTTKTQLSCSIFSDSFFPIEINLFTLASIDPFPVDSLFIASSNFFVKVLSNDQGCLQFL